MRDLTAATAYLETAPETIPWPTLAELDSWTGMTNTRLDMELLDDIQSSVIKNQITRVLSCHLRKNSSPPMRVNKKV